MEARDIILGSMKDLFRGCTEAYELGNFEEAGDFAHDVVGMWERHFKNSSHRNAGEAHELHLAAMMMYYKCLVEWRAPSLTQRLHNAVEKRLLVRKMSHHADAGHEYLQRVLRLRVSGPMQRMANRKDDEQHSLPTFH